MPDPTRVLVVPGTPYAREHARKFEIYCCQHERSFRPSRWIAIYANKQIDTIAEIAGAPVDDVIVSERPEYKELAATITDPETPHRIVKLFNVREIGPIKNDHRDKSGKPIAWVRNQRYTTIDQIERAKTTSQLEAGA